MGALNFIPEPILRTSLGVFLVLLGLSYAYRFLLAALWGKMWYWKGFLPITIVSPLFIHFPPGKNSLIHTKQDWWVHIVLGPIFFFASVGCLAAGADQLGYDGTNKVNNLVQSGVEFFGHKGIEPFITYSPTQGYRFPILDRSSKQVIKTLTAPGNFPQQADENK